MRKRKRTRRARRKRKKKRKKSPKMWRWKTKRHERKGRVLIGAGKTLQVFSFHGQSSHAGVSFVWIRMGDSTIYPLHPCWVKMIAVEISWEFFVVIYLYRPKQYDDVWHDWSVSFTPPPDTLSDLWSIFIACSLRYAYTYTKNCWLGQDPSKNALPSRIIVLRWLHIQISKHFAWNCSSHLRSFYVFLHLAAKIDSLPHVRSCLSVAAFQAPWYSMHQRYQPNPIGELWPQHLISSRGLDGVLMLCRMFFLTLSRCEMVKLLRTCFIWDSEAACCNCTMFVWK